MLAEAPCTLYMRYIFLSLQKNKLNYINNYNSDCQKSAVYLYVETIDKIKYFLLDLIESRTPGSRINHYVNRKTSTKVWHELQRRSWVNKQYYIVFRTTVSVWQWYNTHTKSENKHRNGGVCLTITIWIQTTILSIFSFILTYK